MQLAKDGSKSYLTLTLKKSAELPQFRKDLFVYVDEVDFKGLKPFFSDNFCLYFAHYVLEGIDQAVGFVGAFDKQLPKYEHIMKNNLWWRHHNNFLWCI
jgi:hypothetical protein